MAKAKFKKRSLDLEKIISSPITKAIEKVDIGSKFIPLAMMIDHPALRLAELVRLPTNNALEAITASNIRMDAFGSNFNPLKGSDLIDSITKISDFDKSIASGIVNSFSELPSKSYDAFRHINNLENVVSIIQRNRALYGSFLDFVSSTDGLFRNMNPINPSVSALTMLSYKRYKAFDNIAITNAIDVALGRSFDGLFNKGLLNDLDEFRDISEQIRQDEEIREEFEKFFETFHFKDKDTVHANPDDIKIISLADQIALLISRKFKISPTTAHSFILIIIFIVGELASQIIDGLMTTKNTPTINYHTTIEDNYDLSNCEEYFIARVKVNLRSQPRKDSRLLGILQPEQKVQVLEKRRRWMRVAYEDMENHEPKSGWVYIDYFIAVKKIK